MPYSEVLGCIQYVGVCTRPDLAHCCSQVSRFMQNPGKAHWTAALRILRYLRGTTDHKLHFSRSRELASLVGFADADHAGCLDTRRSHSGYVCKVNSTAVAWISRRQRCVALSLCESENIAVCECAKQVVWMRRLLIELGHTQTRETPIFCDNQAAKSLTENPIHHDRTKHIHMQYHYTRDLVDAGFVVVRYIPAIDEQADILTKEYIGKNFRTLRDAVMGVPANPASETTTITDTDHDKDSNFIRVNLVRESSGAGGGGDHQGDMNDDSDSIVYESEEDTTEDQAWPVYTSPSPRARQKTRMPTYA